MPAAISDPKEPKMTTSVAARKKGQKMDARFANGASRRSVLKAGAGLLAGGGAANGMPASAQAQDTDPELARLQRGRRILLQGGIVLTLDRQLGDFAQADVLIEDGRIRELRPAIAASEDTAVIDAANRILIPGFIDTHSHSYQGILRNILCNGQVDPDYNRDIVGTLTPAFTPDDAYIGMLATALGMIETGTTGVVDVSQVNHTPEHSDALIRALAESGIRAVFAYSRGQGPAAQYPKDLARLQRTYFSSRDQLLTLALGGGADRGLFELARAAGVPMVVHLRNVLPQRNDGDKLAELARAGLMRAGDEYIHCLDLPDETWRLIRDTGGRVSLSPPIEMTMGHGKPAIQQALDHGLRPSLSSDHAVTIASDFFTLMRSTFIAQRYFVLQRGREGGQSLPALLKTRDVLEFATVEGARCANLDGKVGTLAPGKEADIVMLRADRLDVWPINNVAGLVVNLMGTGHLDTVFIAGKVRKWRGRLVNVDEARIRRLMQQSRDAVVRRSNFKLDLLG
jgi:5-methylthioadenosine/S-adenosylhomocysteine deaminase